MVVVLRSNALIGRASEVEHLKAAFADAVTGSGRTVVVSGEAGIGKTRLVEELMSLVAADGQTRALVARGLSADLDAPPYAPLVMVLRAIVEAVGTEAAGELMGAGRQALVRLLPELSEGDDEQTESRSGAARMQEALITFVENVARARPLLVVIEDLHWADASTVSMLRLLSRMLSEARVLFVYTVRSDDVPRGGELRRWLSELERDRSASRLELGRLGRSDVAALMAGIRTEQPSNAEIDAVLERSDGVPFFVEELVCCDGDVVTDGYPSSLRDLLLTRYDALDPDAQRVLRLIAAGGARVEHDLLARVHPGPDDVLESAVRSAVAAMVLTVDGSAYSFRHALVRDAVHDELLPGERVRFHTAYADVLSETDLDGAARSAPIDYAAVSYHRSLAHDVVNAFSASVAAMYEARRTYAHSVAARMGERALELWPRVPDAEAIAGIDLAQLLVDTAYVLRNAGESERAVLLVDEALSLRASVADHRVAMMLRDKASYLANLGQVGSIELLREALALLDDRGDVGVDAGELRANVLGELAARLMLDARFDEAVTTADAAYHQAEAVEVRQRMSVALNIRGTSLIGAGRIEPGLADLEGARLLADDGDSARLRYWVNQSDTLIHLGRYHEAIEVAEIGVRLARERGVERTTGAMLLSNVIGARFALGDTEESDALLDEALRLDPPIGFAVHLQRAKLHSELWAGRAEEAHSLLRRWRSGLTRQQRIEAQSRNGLATIAGGIALANGRVDEAWCEVREILDPRHRPFPAYDLALASVAARIVGAASASRFPLVSAAGEPIEVSVARRRLLEIAEAHAAWPGASARIALIDAELGGAEHTGDSAAAWSAAVEAVDEPTIPVQLVAYALSRLAEALVGEGDRSEARSVVATARAAASSSGAGAVSRALDVFEARAFGTGGSGPGGAGLEPLTERERQVLELVARGLSNKQIAEALFISPKTASVHVSNILRKAGATSRTQAAFVLGEAVARH